MRVFCASLIASLAFFAALAAMFLPERTTFDLPAAPDPQLDGERRTAEEYGMEPSLLRKEASGSLDLVEHPLAPGVERSVQHRNNRCGRYTITWEIR
jgi:hypothetical protein